MSEGLIATARDREAEIDVAIRTLASASGAVMVGSTSDPGFRAGGQRIEFCFSSEPVRAGSPWLPFRGSVGDLAAVGATLKVGLGPEAESSPENCRRAARIAGVHLFGSAVEVSFPATGRPHVDALIDSGRRRLRYGAESDSARCVA